jgi:glucan phosphoethanolaminetransferase (alkaline phosphatase superfamily)
MINSLLTNAFYAILIASVLMLSDVTYSLYNSYFIFDLSINEFFKKVFLLIFFISFIRFSTLRFILLFLIIFASFSQYVHFEYFGKNIQGIEFYLFFTNIEEIFETLESIFFTLLVPFIILLISSLLIYFIEIKFSNKRLTFRYAPHIIIISLLAMNFYVFKLININTTEFTHFHSKWLYPMTNRHSARNFFISLNYFTYGILPKKFSNQTTSFPKLKAPSIDIEKNDLNRTVILLIGESLRYDKIKPYKGNKLTPKLQKLYYQNQIYFQKVYSGGSLTKVSVATLMNGLKYPQSSQQIANEEHCLFRLAKKNNFKTYFISAQSHKKLTILRDIMCPKFIDSFLAKEDFKHFIIPTGYDEDLKTLVKKLDIIKDNSFIVLEHRGSHSPYEKQYPPKYKLYSSYDNTVLYTDSNIYNFIKYLKEEKEKEIIFIYVSDHGELLGENGKHGHGHFEKEVYEVPMITYSNSKDKNLLHAIASIKSHYELSVFITSLLGYKTEVLKDNRDIYILNADIDGFSGYGTIPIKDSMEMPIIRKTGIDAKDTIDVKLQ